MSETSPTYEPQGQPVAPPQQPETLSDTYRRLMSEPTPGDARPIEAVMSEMSACADRDRNEYAADRAAEAIAKAAVSPKAGRGPTRPAILAADLIDLVEKAGPEAAGEFLAVLRRGVTAAGMKSTVREEKRTLAAHVKATEQRIAECDRLADWLADAERLPATMREFVAAALTPVAVPPKDEDDGQEDPAV